MEAISLDQIAEGIRNAVKPVRILWQAPDTIAFVARGREGRSEFHRDPSDEVMYMIKGEMNLHYLTPENEEKIAVVKQGEIIYCPAFTPHSPRFPRDAFLLVMERKRRPEEIDRFSWYCSNCKAEIFETVKHVQDYNDDPVSKVYAEFYGDQAHLTCGKCGHVNPGRPG